MCAETHVCVVHGCACTCGGKRSTSGVIHQEPSTFKKSFYVLLCVCMHDMCGHAHVMVLMWRSEDKLE